MGRTTGDVVMSDDVAISKLRRDSMIRTATAAIALASVAGAAWAAGPTPVIVEEQVVVVEAPAPVPSWQGGYIGG